jgi:DNA-binding PadR family transcriptional regulator
VEPNWEDDDVARADGRPPRKLYKVTKEGRAALREAVKRLGALGLGVAPMAAKRAR